MGGPLAPRRRLFPDLVAVLVVYALVALGSYLFARQVVGSAPGFPDLEGRLPVAVLALLPLSLLAVFALRLRSLALDLRARRYGAVLRARLAGLFLLAVAAASLPQGLFLLRLATRAQSSGASSQVREALASGQELALAWFDEELGRLERAAATLPALAAAATGRPPTAAALLESLRGREPRLAALQLFREGKTESFAGEAAARLPIAPAPPPPGAPGHLLPSAATSGSSILRYALGTGPDSLAVLSLSLPTGLERGATLLGSASRQAELLAPFSDRWAGLLALLYAFLVLPLLLVAALLGVAAADLVAEPLVSLEEATRRVASGDFAVRLIVKPGDETGRLVASFNRMLGEIERYRSDELRRGKIDAWKDIAQRLAHELKNPLTPIRLAAERVLRRWKTDPAGAAPIIEQSMVAIVAEVESMDALLTDFRAFAALPEPQRDWTGLRELVEESVALWAASYPELRFDLEGLPGGLTLRADRAAMKRALGNLVANAVDAMDGAGVVEFRADLVKAADSRYCRLRVRDTGRGIPTAMLGRVFEPYFTTKPSGTGLGLAIVERIVADHGGSIRAESEEGAGATFVLDLPLDR